MEPEAGTETGAETGAEAVWSLDFVAASGELAGFVRLERGPAPGAARFWAYVVGPEVGILAVRDEGLALRTGPARLMVRGEGLWAELVCETPGEHWTVGLEAFGVRLDDPSEGYRGEVGERLALGFDLEWEVTAPDAPGAPVGTPVLGSVVGEVLVGRDRLALDGPGWWTTGGDPDPRRTTPGFTASFGPDGLPVALARSGGSPVDRRATVVVPLGPPPNGPDGARPDALVRVLAGWTDDHGAAKVGWVDLRERR